MTLMKYVSDGQRDRESETQLNLDRPLRISAGPRHLSRALAAKPPMIEGLPLGCYFSQLKLPSRTLLTLPCTTCLAVH
jgi:hypothetical protein